jgi:hypothetical protein
VQPGISLDLPRSPSLRPLRVITPPITRTPDVCTRHGMHKVITRGGRSWRCRR